MRKILSVLSILFLLTSNSWATVGWQKILPQTSENPQAISPDVQENNNAIDLMLQDYRSGHVSITLVSTSEIDVGPGGVMLSNAGGSVRLMVANAALTAVSSTMIDTGTISASSTYYLYAYASSTTATTFSVIFSASATSPTGITYYTRLGSFTTDSSKNFVSVQSDVSAGAISKILNYGTSQSSSTAVSQTSLLVAYGSTGGIGAGGSLAISNLPFTSSSSYVVLLTQSNNQNGNGGGTIAVISSGSAFTIFNEINQTVTFNWMAIGT
jgi:hypothetical protein